VKPQALRMALSQLPPNNDGDNMYVEAPTGANRSFKASSIAKMANAIKMEFHSKNISLFSNV
jgi:hypothetical protein